MILGLSESQAKKKVAQELANQVGEAAASGALMSFSFSAAGISQKSVVNDINTNIENAIIQLQSEMINDGELSSTSERDTLTQYIKGVKLDPDKVISGMWEDAENRKNNLVKNSRVDILDDRDKNWYNDKKIIIDGSHLSKGKLKPNIKYKSGEYDYIYMTDDFARISKVHVEELRYTERDKRLRHNPNTTGKESGDHAGHLIGDRYGGSPDIDNVVSQSALVNLGEYKKLENSWAKALDGGKKVSVDIQVQYDGDSMRPSYFIIDYTVDGKTIQKIVKN